MSTREETNLELPSGMLAIRAADNKRLLLCFIESIDSASANGIGPRAVIGAVPNCESIDRIDWNRFERNPEFCDTIVEFWQNRFVLSPEDLELAATRPTGSLTFAEPVGVDAKDVVGPEIIGWYDIDESGHVIGNRFRYHLGHSLVPTARRGFSFLMYNEPFLAYVGESILEERESGGLGSAGKDEG